MWSEISREINIPSEVRVQKLKFLAIGWQVDTSRPGREEMLLEILITMKYYIMHQERERKVAQKYRVKLLPPPPLARAVWSEIL